MENLLVIYWWFLLELLFLWFRFIVIFLVILILLLDLFEFLVSSFWIILFICILLVIFWSFGSVGTLVYWFGFGIICIFCWEGIRRVKGVSYLIWWSWCCWEDFGMVLFGTLYCGVSIRVFCCVCTSLWLLTDDFLYIFGGFCWRFWLRFIWFVWVG